VSRRWWRSPPRSSDSGQGEGDPEGHSGAGLPRDPSETRRIRSWATSSRTRNAEQPLEVVFARSGVRSFSECSTVCLPAIAKCSSYVSAQGRTPTDPGGSRRALWGHRERIRQVEAKSPQPAEELPRPPRPCVTWIANPSERISKTLGSSLDPGLRFRYCSAASLEEHRAAVR